MNGQTALPACSRIANTSSPAHSQLWTPTVMRNGIQAAKTHQPLGLMLQAVSTRRIVEVLYSHVFLDATTEIGLTWSERVTGVPGAHDRVQPHLVSAVPNCVVTLQVAPVEPHSSRLHISPFLNVWPNRVMSGTVFNCAIHDEL